LSKLFINLEKLLERKGMSQRELSKRTGIRYPSINEMVNNKTSRLPIENLEKICDVLECDISELLILKQGLSAKNEKKDEEL